MNLKDTVRTIPDFPKPGIQYRDLTTLMTNREAFSEACNRLAAPYMNKQIDNVAAIESRGLIFGAPVAHILGAGFVPIRKKGKLPFNTYEQSYDLEYGTDTLEIHADAIRPGEKVLLIDDIIATGGTAAAAISLLQMSKSDIVGAGFVVDLPELGGLKRITQLGIPVTALIAF